MRLFLVFFLLGLINNESETCGGGANNDCLSCDESSERYLNSGKCLCKNGYYDN